MKNDTKNLSILKFIKIKITLLACLFFTLSAFAGNPSQQYSGDNLAESKRAAIKPWNKELAQGSTEERFVLLLSIDGKETELPDFDKINMKSYFISPGEHSIKTALFASVLGKKNQYINPKPMIFKAETGHTYITKAYLPVLKQGDKGGKFKLSFWIEDEKTGEVVSGTKLTK